ncbi:MAG: hypothetical protein ACRD2L_15010 [Terriglobia bacterium]
MTVRKIFFGLVLLVAMGLFALARYDSKPNKPHTTDIEPNTVKTQSLPTGLELPKVETPVTQVGPSAVGTPLLTEGQRLPTLIEPPRIELISMPVQPLSTGIKPLKIEPHTMTSQASIFTAPRPVEPVRIVDSPLPHPNKLPGDILTDSQRQYETAKEVGKVLREEKERERMLKQIREEPTKQSAQPPMMNIPRKP